MALYGGITLPGKPNLENVRRLDLLAVPAIRRLSRLGFAIDIPYCHFLSDKFSREMAELEKDITSYIPPDKLHEFAGGRNEDGGVDDDTDVSDFEFNAASSEQIGKLLFDVLGVGKDKQLKRTKAGDRISTGKAQLRDLELEHPVVPLILAYRERAKLISTYTNALPRIARLHPRSSCCPICELPHDCDTWRVHTEVVQTRAVTGRMASRKPNLTNIPQRTELGSWVRAAFIASPGCKLVSCDFSQIELRMMAHLANCKSMIDVYLEDGDIHTMTAMQCFGIDNPKKLDKISHRIPAKTAGFLCIAHGQRVLTNRGLVPIQNVTCCDTVWDGVEWVSHDGLVFKGYREVITYDGVTATPKHKVWFADGTVGTLEQGKREGLDLAVTGIDEVPVRFNADRQQSDIPIEGAYDSGGILQSVQEVEDIACTKYRNRKDNELPMSRPVQIPGSSRETSSLQVLGDAAKMHKLDAPQLSKLWRAWNQVLFQVCSTIRSLHLKKFAARGLYWFGYWPDKQRRALQTRQSAIGNSTTESTKQTDYSLDDLQRQKDSSARSSRSDKQRFSKFQAKSGTHVAASHAWCSMAGYLESQTEGSIQVPVYDLLNAGPRHRFTVEGRLVSNCLYGGSGKALYAQLLMAMLILISEHKLDKVPEWLTIEWCDQFVAGYFEVRPELGIYMDLQTYRARRYGMVWDLTGRVRLVPEIRSYHPWIKSAGERQGGNMADQGTSSALMKLALAEIDEHLQYLHSCGMWCWPLIPVHDQVMLEVEEESAEDVLEMVTAIMDSVTNDKDTGDNLLRVPIKSDGEVIPRWIKPEEHVWNDTTHMLDRVDKKK